jgi:hypothetical protein
LQNHTPNVGPLDKVEQNAASFKKCATRGGHCGAARASAVCHREISSLLAIGD